MPVLYSRRRRRRSLVGKFQAILQFAAARLVDYDMTAQPCEQIQHLAPGQIGVDSHLAGQVPDVQPGLETVRTGNRAPG